MEGLWRRREIEGKLCKFNYLLVEAPGIEPSAMATGNLLRNAVLARKSPENLAVDVPGEFPSLPSHTALQCSVEAHGRHRKRSVLQLTNDANRRTGDLPGGHGILEDGQLDARIRLSAKQVGATRIFAGPPAKSSTDETRSRGTARRARLQAHMCSVRAVWPVVSCVVSVDVRASLRNPLRPKRA